MKKLLITLLLISPFSFADWGDVYYCQMTTFSITILKGERTDYQLEKFQFKLDKTKNAMVFGSTNHFLLGELTINMLSAPHLEWWFATLPMFPPWSAYFREGKFLSTSINMKETISISANCEKF